MKNQIKFISLLLAVVLMLGSLSVLSIFGASAAEEETTDKEDTTDKKDEEVEETIDYTTLVYASPEEKLKAMLGRNGQPGPWLVKGDYELYVDAFSGEVAYRNTKTGEILFTNPYDIGSSKYGSANTKNELLSQIIIQYTDNNQHPTFVSYEMAALKDQITVKQIKNGIRVQYTLGREQARKLVPGMISVERFDEVIAGRAKENGISDFDYGKLTAYYLKLTLEGLSERARAELIDAFPIVEKMEVYVFDQNASETEKNKIEDYIKTYCPEYTYEELDADHAETEYEAQDKNPPLFKLALEYTLDEHGMTVRLPANGIRFNEQLYQLDALQVLPYMGAGNSAYDGYTFYPDGAGSLYEFDDIDDKNTRTVRGKVYGTDFAYHTITGTYQQAIRFPVFGVVENTVYYDYYEKTEDENTGAITDKLITTLSGSIVDQVNAFNASVSSSQDAVPALVTKYGAMIGNSAIKSIRREQNRGYVAIMEEGDALTDIMTYHAGSLSDYNTVKMVFNPRPSDSYNLQDSISVGSDATWTVVSERKYVGNYKIRYVMLSDSELAEKNGVENYYETSWMGMALAYRDYLDRNNYLTRLKAEDIKDDIPLYIETFGSLETTQRIMSIPVDVMTPLTTFEDVQTMYDELADLGVNNINFKLTGYANGGMFSTVPSKLKWEKTVGGKDGFQALVDYAAEVNGKNDGSHLGIFPDFDFSYIKYTKMFDGVNRDKDAVKTIDDRYASYREYSATKQKQESHYQLAISPSRFNKFYEKLTANYLKYDNVNGISVSTLGNTLNSDFDEDDPYNREDSKKFVATALEYLSGLENNQGQEIELMSEGGNAFTWKYLDHLLDVALDSSRNNDAAHAVPFVGVVLHGYVNFTGAPLNMEGNIQYAMLKAIENGASPYYILSYQNTQNLKEYELLSHYYSVRYDIWKEDVVELYSELNTVLSDVQDKLIMDHEFWNGTRVPDSDELLEDIQNVLDSFLYDELNADAVIELHKKQEVSLARKHAREAAAAAIAALDDAAVAYKQANDMFAPFLVEVENLAEHLDGTPVPEGSDHVCGKDAWTKADEDAAKKAAEENGTEYVSHSCGYKYFLAIDESGAKFEAYEVHSQAEEGTEEYELYQLYLNFRTSRSRYNTARNRRLNDIVNIYNYYAKAQKALLEVESHLEKAKNAVALIDAKLDEATLNGTDTGMLPVLRDEAAGYTDQTSNYLTGTVVTVLKDRYTKDGVVYTIEDDIKAIEQYIRGAIAAEQIEIDKKLAADTAAAWQQFYTDWGKAFGEIIPGTEKIRTQLKADIEKVWNQFYKDWGEAFSAIAPETDKILAALNENIAKINDKLQADTTAIWDQFYKDWGEAFNGIVPGVEQVNKDLATALEAVNEKITEEALAKLAELTDEEKQEREQNNKKVAEELYAQLAPIYAELMAAVEEARATYTDEATLAVVLERLYADAQIKVDRYNLEAVRKYQPISASHATALANQETELLNAIAAAEIRAIYDKPDRLYDAAVAQVEALTSAANAEIAALEQTADQEIAALQAKPDDLYNAAVEQIAALEQTAEQDIAALHEKPNDLYYATVEQITKLEADALEDKKTFTLTEDSKKEIELLCHYKYDYTKLFDTDITNFGQYILGEMIFELTGEENPYPYVELDFTQASFTTYSESAKSLFDQVCEAMISGGYITQKEIDGRLTPIGPSTDNKDDEEQETFDKYAVEEGSIVVVTYGGKNGVDTDAYKSIILNYNNFSVSVEYQDMMYTLPAYGYVVVMQ